MNSVDRNDIFVLLNKCIAREKTHIAARTAVREARVRQSDVSLQTRRGFQCFTIAQSTKRNNLKKKKDFVSFSIIKSSDPTRKSLKRWLR